MLPPTSRPKIAFIGWNPFQLIHVSSLIRNIPNAVFILENKHNSYSQFDKALLNQSDIPVEVYKSKDMHKLDALYDVIVCQTIFTDLYKFNKAKVAMLQYGYGKEVQDYGPWRSLADICFTYGAYATKKINYFCPTNEVGFIRKDEVLDPSFHSKAKKRYGHLIDPKKKTILYLPTWGEYSSAGQYLEKIISMNDEYNVIIKIHHNTELLGKHSRNRNKFHTLGANDDALQLISISDVIISDYSGAIFDAIYCNKPAVLLGLEEPLDLAGKVDEYSIEHARRDELGYTVNSINEIEEKIKKALKEGMKVETKLCQELFKESQSIVVDEVYCALVKLRNGDIKISQQQRYVRTLIKEFYALKSSKGLFGFFRKK